MNLLRPALCLALSMPVVAFAADDVRVYRCVGSNGAVALQDMPCSSGRQFEATAFRREDREIVVEGTVFS